jgi:hypothetical protein
MKVRGNGTFIHVDNTPEVGSSYSDIKIAILDEDNALIYIYLRPVYAEKLAARIKVQLETLKDEQEKKDNEAD